MEVSRRSAARRQQHQEAAECSELPGHLGRLGGAESVGGTSSMGSTQIHGKCPNRPPKIQRPPCKFSPKQPKGSRDESCPLPKQSELWLLSLVLGRLSHAGERRRKSKTAVSRSGKFLCIYIYIKMAPLVLESKGQPRGNPALLRGSLF